MAATTEISSNGHDVASSPSRLDLAVQDLQFDTVSCCHTCQSMAEEIDAFYKELLDDVTDEPPSFHPTDYIRKELIVLGSWEDMEHRSHCTSCQEIIRSLRRNGHRPSSQLQLSFGLVDNCLYISVEEGIRISFLELRVLDRPTRMHETGRTHDAHEIDINLIRKWVDCCETSHGEHCLPPSLSSSLNHISLIDVQEGRLVAAPIDSRYIALSYVWGNAATVQTTMSNLMALKEPESIRADSDKLTIPNTIRDALRLVGMLGERFLWVDSLCIVQDDYDTKQLHLNSMASIYANALFTIIAADGKDANHGLRGIGGGAQARDVPCDIIRFQNGTRMNAYRERSWSPDHSIWNSRGWTFQEGLFSRRILVFNGLVSWICRRAIWEEHVNNPTEDMDYASTHGLPPFDLHLATRIPDWPELEKWRELVRVYNQRKLRYDEDAVGAFAGAISAFSSRFSGGMLWGMPEMFFDYCITWEPKGLLRRRGVCSSSSSENPLPSWSWVGWEGEIISPGTPVSLASDPEYENRRLRIQSAVQWYRSSSPTSKRCRVNNIWYALQELYLHNSTETVLAGWSRSLHADGTPYYTHIAVPSERFRYPIPLVNKDFDGSQNEQGRFLHFKSQRAWLSIGPASNDERDQWATCLASFVNEHGQWAGCTRLNVPRSEGAPAGERCELVALFSGAGRNDADLSYTLDEWNMAERPRHGEFYRFYYVMWIEWEDGIASRKAVGRVHQDAWESLPREDVDVVLG